jgi:hypothetical protein
MEEDIGLDLESGLELFFSKKLKQTITHPSSCVFCDSFTSDAQRMIINLQVAHPVSHKSLNLIKE